MNFSSFWSDVAATILGGVVLTGLFFLAKEKFFPFPTLTGRWYLEQLTESTRYNPFIGMILRYVVILWCEGSRVEGTAEKIYEKSSTGERSFDGKNRTRARVSGHIEKKYFGKDKIFLHVVEEGHGRESTHSYDLIIFGKDGMAGTFTSMVAEQGGPVTWRRAPF